MSPTTITAALLIVLAAAPTAVPAQRSGPGRFEEIAAEDPEKALSYVLFEPSGVKQGKRYPLVLAIHGTGQPPLHHARQMSLLSSSDAPVFVVAPQYERTAERFAPMYDHLRSKFLAIVDAVAAEHPVDRSRLVLAGHSRGAHLSTRWAGSASAGDPAAFPFREVWGCGGGDPPRGTPAVPSVHVAGERDTNLWGKHDCRAACRRSYRGFFARGGDAWYHEIPGVGHDIEEHAVELWRPRLARLRSHADGIPRRRVWPPALVPAIASFRVGRFAEAIGTVEAVLAAASDDRKLRSRAESLLAAFEGHIAKAASKLARAARSRRSTVHDYTAARARAALLETARPELAAAFAAAAETLAGKRHLQKEVAAFAAFDAARQAGEGQRDAMQALASGDLGDTVYGHRAAQHLLALGEATRAAGPPGRRDG